MTNYAIAYTDKNGKDFNGIPWVLEDFNSKEECMEKTNEMKVNGFKKVIPFIVSGKEEEISWNYVIEHQIL